MYTREAVKDGSNIRLRAVFTDGEGNLVSTDAAPSVYIYDSSVDSETRDAEVDAGTFTSATAGPVAATVLSPGYYEINYSVPVGADEGYWHDVWVADVNAVTQANTLSFKVFHGVELDAQTLTNNKMVAIQLSGSIANADGTKILGSARVVGFSTVYTPLYASPSMLRAEVGLWIGDVPDDTLAYLLHWSSKEVDFIKPGRVCNSKNLKFAKARFVVFDTALKLMNLPGGPTGRIGAASLAGARKQLGNLSIMHGRAGLVGVNSAGIDADTVKYIRQQRDEWWRVVNAGACITPGQGLSPQFAVRGIRHPTGRRNSGRLWSNEKQVMPTSNVKERNSLYELARFKYRDLPTRW